MHKIKILVFGTGSAAYRHVKCLKKIIKKNNVFVYSPNIARSNNFAKKNNISVEKNPFTNINTYSGIIIANANNKHFSTIKKLIKYKKNILCEKPIVTSIKEFKYLQKNIKKLSLIDTCFQLRTNECIQKIKNLIYNNKKNKLLHFRFFVGYRYDLWRPNNDYSKLRSAGNKTSAGVIWELSHEIDLLRFLLGNTLKASAYLTKVSNLKIKVPDLANIIIKLKNGVTGNIQLDMVSPVYRRGIELVFEKFILNFDYNKGIIKKTDKNNISKIIFKKKESPVIMTMKVIKNFIKSIKNYDNKKVCTINDSLNSVKLINKIITNSNKIR
jgi:predicted dehydrogenase